MRTCSEQFWFIMNHPDLNHKHLAPVIEIEPHTICESTGRIEKYDNLNNKLQLWIELRRPFKNEDDDEYVMCHDYEFDCGGFTYEEAIQSLYDLVIAKFGDKEPDYSDSGTFNIYKPSNKAEELRSKFNLKSVFIADSYEFNSRISKESLKDSIEETKKTISALKDYISTVTDDDLKKEYEEYLSNEEHDLWVIEASLKVGLDLDLR